MMDVNDELAAAKAKIAELESSQAAAHRNAEVQSALYRIAETASTARDLQAFYAAIHGIVAGLMFGENFYIALYDEERGLINFPYYRDSVDLAVPDPDLWEPFGIGNARGLTAYVLRTAMPQHVPAERLDVLAAAGEVALVGEAGEDWLGVPLQSDGRTLGALVVQTYRPGERYTESDAAVLAFVGHHVATALTRVRAIDEVRQRNAELAVVNEIGTALIQQREFQAIIEAVGDHAAAALGVRGLSICILDPTTDELRFHYWVDDGVRNRAREGVVLGDALSAEILRTGRPVRIGSAEEAAARGTPFAIGGTESYLGVPIPAGGRTIGIFALGTREPRAYSETDERLLTTMASSMGVGLENARLFEETNRLLADSNARAAELSVISDIGQTLVGQLDIREIIEAVGDRIAAALDVTGLSISVVDPTTNELTLYYWIDDGERLRHMEGTVLGDALSAEILRVGKPVRVGSAVDAAARGTPLRVAGTESYLGVAIPAGDRSVGVIALGSHHRDLFGPAEERLLSTLAASMGAALENARLFHETRQQTRQLQIINDIGKAVAAQLDLDSLIELVGDEMRNVFDADIVYVALLDEESERIEFPYYSEDGRQQPQEAIELGEGLTSRILQARAPLLLNQDAQFEQLGTRGLGTLARSYLGVPILVGDEAIGVISVQSSTEVGRFDEVDARLLSTLAASVGVAIRTARAFRAQQQAEEQYRRLVEELPLSIYTDYPDNTSTSMYASPGTVAMFGYPIEQWMQPAFFTTVVHPDDRERVMGEVGTNLAGADQKTTYEYRIIAADGRTVWVRDDSWIVRDENGEPMHVQGFMLDITEQTLAAAEIRRQKQYFEALVEISPVAIVTMDRDEVVSGWNPAATRLFGYEPDEAIGRHIDDLLFSTDERGEGAATTRLADETGLAQLIGRRRRKDGEPVDVEIVLVPLIVDGDHTGYYAIYHDITELQAARREADAANEAKSTFLAAMSHEIRTPMNAIIGMSGLLAGTQLDDEQRDFAETIRTSGESLLTIINDVLDFSKIEAGRIELEAVPFALGACLEGTIDVVAPAAAAKGIELAYTKDPGLPHALVGDAGRLRQIVLNLLSNAVKFTESGEVLVSVSGQRLPRTRGSHEAPRWQIEVEVRDTGIGIPADRMDRLFQSFSQADASISRRFGGTGLGLVISRRLAELQGGSITAESSGVPGEGSRFRVTIVAPEAPAEAVAPPPPPASAELAGKVALVVDDSATNRRIVDAHLHRWGMVARSTGDPDEAIEWARQGERFDIALVDLAMPDTDGLALAAALSELTEPRPLPVVVISSLGHRERLEGNVVAWLTKPIKPSPLLDALHDVLADVDRGSSTQVTPVTGSVMADRHPLRILLAEDNAVNQKLALRLLQQVGYGADLATNGVEAIAALEAGTYDLVLMDVQMPELDGLEATRRIRARWPGTTGPRIVAMTANAMAGDREACLAAGMDDYISKPIRPAELEAALLSAPSPVLGTADG